MTIAFGDMTSLAYSNLGGRGPDSEPNRCLTSGTATCMSDAADANKQTGGCCLRYDNVGSMYTGTSVAVDLIIETTGGYYTCANCARNGVNDPDGVFGVINLEIQRSVKLTFTFVERGTSAIISPAPPEKFEPPLMRPFT